MADINVKTQIIDRDELAKFIPLKNFRLIKFFENLASDVSTTIPDAIGSSVQGPSGGSVDDNVVLFDGTDGLHIKDSGVSIDDLAPLDSPVFTGSPRAPTPLPGDSSTRIATTAFIQGEISAGVDGPASATNNAIALFDGVTGKLIKDSATLLTSVAPLASPTFTGDPKAPTPALNDNDTSIATTAFVQTALGNGAAYFSAHNNSVSQAIPTGAFTVLSMSTEVFDVGSFFASNAWTPPTGRPVMLTGEVVVSTTLNTLVILSVFKNGAEFKRGVQHASGGSNSVGATVTCIDVPNGTDVYDLRVFQNTGVSQNTTSTAAVTWFQGTTVRA